jgi:hypothetical protein
LPAARPRARAHVEVMRREAEGEGITRIVLAYIAAVAASLGIMLGLMHGGW